MNDELQDDLLEHNFQKKHFRVSMIKSGLRILGCVLGLFGSLSAFVLLFLVAELLGIYEEM